jgi:hypothetical protein
MRRVWKAAMLGAACLALGAVAQVYKYVDKEGKVQYGDQPPPDGKKDEMKIEKGAETKAQKPAEWRDKERQVDQALIKKRKLQNDCAEAKRVLPDAQRKLEEMNANRVKYYHNGREITPALIEDLRRIVRDACAN